MCAYFCIVQSRFLLFELLRLIVDISRNGQSRTHEGNGNTAAIDPPTFSPTKEMRAGYLQRRKDELEALVDSARAGEWKPVMTVVTRVRGTGAMYGFENIGAAAEAVSRAVQNGDPDSFGYMEAYARSVNESYV